MTLQDFPAYAQQHRDVTHIASDRADPAQRRGPGRLPKINVDPVGNERARDPGEPVLDGEPLPVGHAQDAGGSGNLPPSIVGPKFQRLVQREDAALRMPDAGDFLVAPNEVDPRRAGAGGKAVAAPHVKGRGGTQAAVRREPAEDFGGDLLRQRAAPSGAGIAPLLQLLGEQIMSLMLGEFLLCDNRDVRQGHGGINQGKGRVGAAPKIR